MISCEQQFQQQDRAKHHNPFLKNQSTFVIIYVNIIYFNNPSQRLFLTTTHTKNRKASKFNSKGNKRTEYVKLITIQFLEENKGTNLPGLTLGNGCLDMTMKA